MAPVPAPIQDDIRSVNEIARIKSYATAAILVDALNDSQWGRALDLVGRWDSLDAKDTKIVNGLLGANVDPDRARHRITNLMRELLGLEPVTMAGTIIETSSSSGGFAASAVKITSDW